MTKKNKKPTLETHPVVTGTPLAVSEEGMTDTPAPVKRGRRPGSKNKAKRVSVSSWNIEGYTLILLLPSGNGVKVDRLDGAVLPDHNKTFLTVKDLAELSEELEPLAAHVNLESSDAFFGGLSKILTLKPAEVAKLYQWYTQVP